MARQVYNRRKRPFIGSDINESLQNLSKITFAGDEASRQKEQSLQARGLTQMARNARKNRNNRINEQIQNIQQSQGARQLSTGGTDIAQQQVEEARIKATPQSRNAGDNIQDQKLSQIVKRKQLEEAEQLAKQRVVALSGSGFFPTTLTPEERKLKEGQRANALAQAKQDVIRISSMRELEGGQEQQAIPTGGMRRGETVTTPSHSQAKRGKRERAIIDALLAESKQTREQRTKQAIKDADTESPETVKSLEAVEGLEKQAEEQASPEGQAILNETRVLQRKIDAGEKLEDFEQELLSRTIGIDEYNKRKRTGISKERKAIEKEQNIKPSVIKNKIAKNKPLSKNEKSYFDKFMSEDVLLDDKDVPVETVKETVFEYQLPDGSRVTVVESKLQEFLDKSKAIGIKPIKITRERR